MNPTMIAIILAVILLAIGFVLMLIGGQFRQQENRIEVNETKKQEDLGRIDFLRKYTVQIESMHNQQLIGEEEYESELAWVNAELDELEGETE